MHIANVRPLRIVVPWNERWAHVQHLLGRRCDLDPSVIAIGVQIYGKGAIESPEGITYRFADILIDWGRP